MKRLFEPGFSKKYIRHFASLQDLFSRIMALEPWRYADEFTPLAVRNPVTGALFYGIFMSKWSSLKGFTVVDAAGMRSWEAVQSELAYEDPLSDEIRLQQYCQLAKVKKSELDTKHLLAYQTAGIPVSRGRNCMQALSQEPGYPPEMISAARLEELLQVLPGLLFLLEEMREQRVDNPDRFEDEDPIPAAISDAQGTWQATQIPLAPGELPMLPELPQSLLRRYIAPLSLPDSDEAYVLHAAVLSTTAVNTSGRRYYPIAMILVGLQSRRMLGLRIMEYANWAEQAIPHLMALIAATGEIPQELNIVHSRVDNLADVASDLLMIVCDYSDDAFLSLDYVLESFLEKLNATDFTPAES